MKAGGGIASALCWYKVVMGNYNHEAEKELSKERYPIAVPTFFFGCEFTSLFDCVGYGQCVECG